MRSNKIIKLVRMLNYIRYKRKLVIISRKSIKDLTQYRGKRFSKLTQYRGMAKNLEFKMIMIEK